MSIEARIEPGERVLRFLGAERLAKETDICTPPGLPAMTVKWFRIGRDMGALVLHHRGEGYCLAALEVNRKGRKPDGGTERATQVAPAVLEWERRMDYELQRSGPSIGAQLVKERVADAQRRLSGPKQSDLLAHILGGGFE